MLLTCIIVITVSGVLCHKRGTLFSGVGRAYGRAVEHDLGGPDPRLVLGGEADGGGQQARAQSCGGPWAGALRPRQRHHAHAQRRPAPLRLHAAVAHAAGRQLHTDSARYTLHVTRTRLYRPIAFLC